MKGKRESQKRELRDRILAAAQEVFEANGCRRSTMQEIAERAHVGLGTAYNYFASKEELFLLSVAERLFLESSNALPAEIKGDNVEVVFEHVKGLLGRIESYGKEIWQEVVAALFAAQPSNGELITRMMNADLGMIDGLKRLLVALKHRGSLAKEFDAEVGAEVVYSAVMSQLVSYFFDTTATYDDLVERIRSRIAFILR